MFSDSSKSGYGASFETKFLYGEFPMSWTSLDIQVLELFPIFLLIHVFTNALSNNQVTFHCDNIAIGPDGPAGFDAPRGKSQAFETTLRKPT